MYKLENWNKDFLIEFIDLYRRFPCLWDVQAKEFAAAISFKQRQRQANKILLNKLKELIPNCNMDILSKHLNYLYSSFSKEHKKVVASGNIGGPSQNARLYKPSIWYYDKLLFLRKKDVGTIQSTSTAAAGTATNQSAVKRNNCALISDIRPPAKIRRTEIPENQICSEDECDAVGKNISYKLRALPKPIRFITEKLMTEILFQAEMGNINNMSTVQFYKRLQPRVEVIITPLNETIPIEIISDIKSESEL